MKLLILILTAAPVFVPGVVGRVASLSTTRFGTTDLVASSVRRETRRRGLGERRSDVRHRQHVPNTQHAPVEVEVQVTMPMTNNKTTRMLMTTTTANVSIPAGTRRRVQVHGGVSVAVSRRWSYAGVVTVDGLSPGAMNGSRRMPARATLLQ